MMRIILLIGISVLFAKPVQAQYNDTIVLKSGMRINAEIDSFNYRKIHFHYISNKGDTIVSNRSMRSVVYFIKVDVENKIEFDSMEKYASGIPLPRRDSLWISPHTLSINPFPIPLGGVNLRYNYVFGKQMQWAFNGRFTYMSPLVFKEGGHLLLVGAGMKFIPFYSERSSFGVDFTPGYFLGNDPSETVHGLVFPLSFNFDIFFTKRLGLAIDFGGGYCTTNAITGSAFTVRAHIGLLIQMGNKCLRVLADEQ
jgi:hypothetical protein